MRGIATRLRQWFPCRKFVTENVRRYLGLRRRLTIQNPALRHQSDTNPPVLTPGKQSQAELNLPRGPERVHACSDADTIYVVAKGSGSIDLSRSSRQQSI